MRYLKIRRLQPLLIPSDFTIAIRPSKDFLKVGVLLHTLACVLLWTSSLSLFCRIGLCLAMLISSWCFAYKTIHFNATLFLRAGSWILQTSTEITETYEHLSIEFEGGFCQWRAWTLTRLDVERLRVNREQSSWKNSGRNTANGSRASDQRMASQLALWRQESQSKERIALLPRDALKARSR